MYTWIFKDNYIPHKANPGYLILTNQHLLNVDLLFTVDKIY